MSLLIFVTRNFFRSILISSSSAKTLSQTEEPIVYHNASSDPYQGNLDYFNAFEQGFQGNEISGNFSNCMHRYILLKHKESNTYAMKLHYGDFSETVFNTTGFVKNSSFLVSHCTDTVHGFFLYAMLQKSYHNTTTSLLLSVLQNLLGNALEINNVSKQMKLYPSESLEE